LGLLGLSTANFLAIQKALGESTAPPAASSPVGRAKSIILVYLGGGLSHHDSFDLKPGASEEIRGKYKPIPSNVPGLQVGELLPKMAQTMDKVCLVRSGSHENDHHETATNWVLSGRFGSPFGDYPSMGAVVAHETGFSGLLPPYVAIPKNPSFSWELGKSSWLGGRYESFKGGDPSAADYKVRDLSLAMPLKPASAQRRQSLLRAVDTLAEKVKGNDQMATYDEFQRHAAEMVLSTEAQSAFDMDRESPEMRDAYGRTEFGQSCLLARRLVERGVRFIELTCPAGAGDRWDQHASLKAGHEKNARFVDQPIAGLLKDLKSRGLLDSTLVVWAGEFGRTPFAQGKDGRDHNPFAFTIWMAGGGVKGGTTFGTTDEYGYKVVENKVTIHDLHATMLHLLGIDHTKLTFRYSGRDMRLTDVYGEVIKEILA
jgi:hypothetical protein